MRIGILTLPLHTNYGGILQAYALQTVLERMGHEVVVLDKEPIVHVPFMKLVKRIIKRVIKKYILRRKNVYVFQERHNKKIYPILSQYTQQFIDKYIHAYTVCDLEKINSDDFDAIVVGSDQVWRPIYFCAYYPNHIDYAFLSFARDWNIKRIAYAPSFGTDVWEYDSKQTQTCKELIKLFDNVSVREKDGVDLCRNNLNIAAEHVLDPTMLLCAEDYIKLFEASHTPKSKGTLLNYILDETPEKTSLIDYVAKERKIKPFRVNSKIENSSATLEERIQPPVEQWLRGFYDAEFVITDSFHACVFSILFKKQFIVYGNKERGLARFHSLLKMFGLEDRLVTCDTQIQNIQDIDYNEVYKQYNVFKEYSYSFLKNAINKC